MPARRTGSPSATTTSAARGGGEKQQAAAHNGTAVALTAEILRKHERRTTPKAFRTFGCDECNLMWIKKVYASKPVATCKGCREKYEAIPLDKVPPGVGVFHCQCKHVWTSRPSTPDVLQDCHKCGEKSVPLFVTLMRPRRGARKSDSVHSCSECGWGRVKPCPLASRRGLVASKVHDSTGSTNTSIATSFDINGMEIQKLLRELSMDDDDESDEPVRGTVPDSLRDAIARTATRM